MTRRWMYRIRRRMNDVVVNVSGFEFSSPDEAKRAGEKVLALARKNPWDYWVETEGTTP